MAKTSGNTRVNAPSSKKSVSNEKIADAMSRYAGVLYLDVNGYLRNGKPWNKDKFEKQNIPQVIESMREAFATKSLTESTFYRGLYFDKEIDASLIKPFAEMKPGDIFQDKGFVSVTKSRSIAENNYGDNVLLVLKGKALSMGRYSALSKDEKEYLFKDNTKFVVEKNEQKNGKIIITMRQK